MDQIFTGIIVTLISALIMRMFGFGGSTRVRIENVTGVSKIWKIFIFFGWIMFIGGALYGFSWGAVEGLEDYRTGLGLSFFTLGIILLSIGKLGAWWNSRY